MSVFREIDFVFEQITTNQEEIEAATTEEKNAEETVVGGIVVGVEVSEAWEWENTENT